MRAMYIWHIYMYIIFIKKKDVVILCKIKQLPQNNSEWMRMAYKLHFLLFFLPRNSPRWWRIQFPHTWLVGCLSRGCKTVLPWAETLRRHQTHWRCARTLPSLKKKIQVKLLKIYKFIISTCFEFVYSVTLKRKGSLPIVRVLILG